MHSVFAVAIFLLMVSRAAGAEPENSSSPACKSDDIVCQMLRDRKNGPNTGSGAPSMNDNRGGLGSNSGGGGGFSTFRNGGMVMDKQKF